MGTEKMTIPYEVRELRNVLEEQRRRTARAVPNDDRVIIHDEEGNLYYVHRFKIDEEGLHFHIKKEK